MKINATRQITLPLDLCKSAGIEKGDEVEIFIDKPGVISIVKKESLEKQRLQSLNELSALDQELGGIGYK
ncbi:MAG: AbrB/MazE/SpoVT family DNA-binding domain-containing protein [Colwellia sp.]|nr:AbrB/MazE/SpoVT family DNA-binding domain-containing protein [Colwellia sp.]